MRFLALILLTSCYATLAPRMDRKVKIYNGSPENVGICRMSTKELALPLKSNVLILRHFHKSGIAMDCISAQDEQFKQFACLTFDDLGVLYDYIETLIYQCKKWK